MRAKLAGAGGVGVEQRKVVRQMGADGWLGVGWPKEWGGRGFSAVEQFIWFDESMRAGAPVPMLTINTVGPTIMNFGSDEQKEFFLPKILKGEIHFCIGYSEPGAGTDLAALDARRPSATATSTSSTVRRCGRASPATPTTSGSRCARTRT